MAVSAVTGIARRPPPPPRPRAPAALQFRGLNGMSPCLGAAGQHFGHHAFQAPVNISLPLLCRSRL